MLKLRFFSSNLCLEYLRYCSVSAPSILASLFVPRQRIQEYIDQPGVRYDQERLICGNLLSSILLNLTLEGKPSDNEFLEGLRLSIPLHHIEEVMLQGIKHAQVIVWQPLCPNCGCLLLGTSCNILQLSAHTSFRYEL